MDEHFNFGTILGLQKLFKNVFQFSIKPHAKYKVNIFYAGFDSKLEKICNKRLARLCKKGHVNFLNKLEEDGYIFKST